MDFYDDASGRSPRLLRNPTMNNRPPGRADGFGAMQGIYGGDNGMAPPAARFNSMRDPFAAPSNMNAVSMNFPYDANAASTWSAAPPVPHFSANGINALPQNGDFGPPSRSVKHSRGRIGLQNVRRPVRASPSMPRADYVQLWYDNGQGMPPPPNPSIVAPRPSPSRQEGQDDDDELIPTAIVIKNIPFAVKKEQLVQLMVDMNLPLPYAFNYHFDNGVFRGLAFANFTSPNETEAVIQALNQMELSGRKLRVEYKKMLPLAERERIEREKRERRGQLEEQHRPVIQSQLHNQLSLSSISRNTPSPLSQRAGGAKPEVDMNDPETLKFYTEMTLFRNDPTREVLIFSPTLTPEYRRVVHTLAHQLGLQHTSRGTGDQRQVHVTRPAPGTNVSPPSISGSFTGGDGRRQPLARASTSDFGEGRSYEPLPFNNNLTLRGQSSVGMLDVEGYTRNNDTVIRNAKSFADLRTWSPSPAASSASFPTALQTNAASTSGAGAGPSGRDPEPFLISGFSSLSIANGSGPQTSPRRQRSLFGAGWDDSQTYTTAGPIGSKRAVSTIGTDSAADRNPLRQPRGATPNSAMGFRHPAAHATDELRTATTAIAE
ncbi:hypothetical protein DV736_g4823, partial [Chaetothyriales sp. CBS 134916]